MQFREPLQLNGLKGVGMEALYVIINVQKVGVGS